jgi:acetylornithine deacetylase/succinyl-diaminopimelate desuccinylase-like protein
MTPLSENVVQEDDELRVLEWINAHEQDLSMFLLELLRIPSTPTNTAGLNEAAELVARALRSVGVDVDLMECGSAGIKNVQAQYGPVTENGLIFNGHLDIYPPSESWTRDPFDSEIVDGRIYGVGVSDMKSGAAAMTMALKALAATGFMPKQSIALLAVPNHFDGGQGTRWALRNGLKARYAINCEPSSMKVLTGQRGIAYIDAHVRGRASHTTAQDIGVNAIERASRLILEVLNMPITGRDGEVLHMEKICNVAMIAGGIHRNLIPEVCDVTFDFRFPPEQDQDCVMRDLQHAASRALPDLDQFPIEFEFHESIRRNPRSSLSIPSDTGILEVLERAHERTTNATPGRSTHPAWPDTPIFWEAGIEAATYGPGSMDCYWDDESISVDEYLTAIRTYALAAIELTR